MDSITIGRTTITVTHADLTTMEVDVIVNAANVHLEHGGGVAGAIAAAGGDIIQAESTRWVAEHGRLSPGVAAVTSAGALPCRRVVHVAGPIYRDGQDNQGLLVSAVEAALQAAAGESCRSVAMPAISAGIYGYPAAEATRVIAAAVMAWAGANQTLDEVFLVGFDRSITAAFESGLAAAASG